MSNKQKEILGIKPNGEIVTSRSFYNGLIFEHTKHYIYVSKLELDHKSPFHRVFNEVH